MEVLPIFCVCKHFNEMTDYWTSHLFGYLVINKIKVLSVRNLQSFEHFMSNKSNTSYYSHPV